MSAPKAWKPVTRQLRLMSPASHAVMAGRPMVHTPIVDGSITFSIPPLLRSRSRTRRRRRKRSWAAPWAPLGPLCSPPTLLLLHLRFSTRTLGARTAGTWGMGK